MRAARFCAGELGQPVAPVRRRLRPRRRSGSPARPARHEARRRLPASGHASPLTRAIAAASSRPRSDGLLRRQPAPRHHRLGAALLERRVVEIGIGPRRQHFEGERRGLREVAGDHLDRARLDALRAAVPGRRGPSPRSGNRRSPAGPADGRGSRARRRGSRRRRSGRERPSRSDPRRPCARAAAAPSCRRGSAAERATRRRPSASAW